MTRERFYEWPSELPWDVGNWLNRILGEAQVLKSMEEILSKLVESASQDAISGKDHGVAWLHRGHIGAFEIEYTPSESAKKEFGLRYFQVRIAQGDFLEKEIEFRGIDEPGRLYLKNSVVPALKDFFLKIGFKIK